VTDDGRLVVEHRGRVVADVPADLLVLGGGAPVYIREAREPAYLATTRAFRQDDLPDPGNLNQVLLRLLASPNISSKRWVYTQYDHMVRTNNILQPEGDAAVVLLKGTNRALAVKTDCNARHVYLSPYMGGMGAVAEAARNVVCTGARPIAITNCLNFGNPYDPEVYWQFREAVRGIGDACRALDTPVTGGNVSFYNESPETTVYPTPVIGMLGLLENLQAVTGHGFRDEGDVIAVIGGPGKGHIGGSEYLALIHNIVAGEAPPLDIQVEKNVQTACLESIKGGLIKSAHDVSDGGIAVALAESCMAGNVGALIEIPQSEGSRRPDFQLFGEDHSRVIVSISPADAEPLKAMCSSHRVKCVILGRVTGTGLVIGREVDLAVDRMSELYRSALGVQMT
jgi:phosphoribosylformylglycinamidine synthase